MKHFQRGFGLAGLLIILGLLIAGGGAYWWVQTHGLALFAPGASGFKTYTSQDKSFAFRYPAKLMVSLQNKEVFSTNYGTDTIPFPAGSVQILGVITLAKASLSTEDISKEKPFLSYTSCCSGTSHWYDPKTATWRAEKFEPGGYDDNNQPLPQKKKTLSLTKQNGECSIAQKFGTHTYYMLDAWDEGLPHIYYYYLITNKGYAIRAISLFDLQADYSKYQKEDRPDPEMLAEASQILSSLELEGGATEVQAACAGTPPTETTALPTNVGQCSMVTVANTGTRLTDGVTGGPLPGSGDSISYTNGGRQVSYDTVLGIQHSRAGDEVQLCLVSIPQDCPPGDSRGKIYSAKNLRTNETWEAADSQHACGGA